MGQIVDNLIQMFKVPQLLKSGLRVGATEATILGFTFVRNIVLARLLTTDDYGTCVLIAAVWSSVELLSDIGLDKMLLQQRQSSPAELQPTLTTLLVIRGAVVALFTMALAKPMASFFGVEQAEWAFQALGPLVFLRSLSHLDFKRVQREGRYGPEITIRLATTTAEFIVAVSLALLLRSYAALVFAMLAGAATGVVVSHLCATTRYRLSWEIDVARRAIIFGWPLLGNGLIIVLMGQADRMLIGRSTSLAELATYAVCLSILATPSSLLDKTALLVVFPYLAKAAADKQAFADHFRVFGISNAVATAIVLIPLTLLGDTIIPAIFGAKFRPPPGLIAAIVLWVAAVRVRGWIVTGALAVGDTKGILLPNIVRLVGFALAVTIALFRPSLVGLVFAFALGDMIATFYSILRMNQRTAGVARDVFSGLAVLVVYLGAALLVQIAYPNLHVLASAALALCLMVLAVFTALLLSPDLRKIAQFFK